MIELAGPDTARYVAEHLGPDEICVKEYGQEDARELCFETARDSLMSWAVIASDGEPVCLFGADGDPDDDWGSVWMFSTANVRKAKIEMIKGAREAIEFSRRYWPELRLFTEERSPKQKRFLEFIGFTPRDEDETELVI